MKFNFFVFLAFLSAGAIGADLTTEDSASKVIGEAYGDLDKDGLDEKVSVLDTGLEGEMGTERILLIYKKINDKWTIWHSSQGPILSSAHGGMMGDAFQGVQIHRGSIVIEHFGGSRDKWNYTHRYRFNGKSWNLIGATIDYGSPCEGFTKFDYNLATGKAIYKEYDQGCPFADITAKRKNVQKELSFGVSELPNMDAFYPGDNQIEIKDLGTKLYY